MIESEGYRHEEQHRLRENVSAEEYREAIQTLSEFALRDMSGVTSVESLAQMTESVSSALRAVALAKGDITPEQVTHHEPTQRNVFGDESLVVDTFLGGDARLVANIGKKEIVLRTWMGRASWDGGPATDEPFVSVRLSPNTPDASESEGSYEVTLLAGRPLDIAGTSLLDTLIRGQEYRGGRWVQYVPRKHPTNTQIQRAYAHLVQAGVKDIISLNLPQPTTVPAAFYE